MDLQGPTSSVTISERLLNVCRQMFKNDLSNVINNANLLKVRFLTTLLKYNIGRILKVFPLQFDRLFSETWNILAAVNKILIRANNIF